jgi:hypothetical protein
MRGLEENIWKVLAPISTARLTAVQHPPVVLRCTPIRRAPLSNFPSFAMSSRLPEKNMQRTLNLYVYHHHARRFYRSPSG